MDASAPDEDVLVDADLSLPPQPISKELINPAVATLEKRLREFAEKTCE
tara:strand:+ start:484 stop:630 length:147 start_codon:yes stop_codon:yes gene_type:complete